MIVQGAIGARVTSLELSFIDKMAEAQRFEFQFQQASLTPRALGPRPRPFARAKASPTFPKTGSKPLLATCDIINPPQS
jgi:hypothetical protein